MNLYAITVGPRRYQVIRRGKRRQTRFRPGDTVAIILELPCSTLAEPQMTTVEADIVEDLNGEEYLVQIVVVDGHHVLGEILGRQFQVTDEHIERLVQYGGPPLSQQGAVAKTKEFVAESGAEVYDPHYLECDRYPARIIFWGQDPVLLIPEGSPLSEEAVLGFLNAILNATR